MVFLDVNECVVYQPCQNNGTCTNSEGSYTCTCENGWIDQHCETGLYQTHIVHKFWWGFFVTSNIKLNYCISKKVVVIYNIRLL